MMVHNGTVLVLVAVFVIFCCTEVVCFNATSSRSFFNSKYFRVVSFDTDGDLGIDLDFNVPFLSLPIKKSLDTAKSALVNLNVGALVLTGVFIFGAMVTLPIILTFFHKKGLISSDSNLMGGFYQNQQKRGEDSILWNYLMAMDRSLLDNHVDITSCSQRVMCWMVKASSENVAKGIGSSIEKIFDGLISSHWFQEKMLNSVLIDAVNSGFLGKNCSHKYQMCQIDYDWFKIFFDKFNRN